MLLLLFVLLTFVGWLVLRPIQKSTQTTGVSYPWVFAYPGATVQGDPVEDKGNCIGQSFMTTDRPDAVTDYYRRNYQREGWTEYTQGVSHDPRGFSWLYFQRGSDGRKARVMIYDRDAVVVVETVGGVAYASDRCHFSAYLMP